MIFFSQKIKGRRVSFNQGTGKNLPGHVWGKTLPNSAIPKGPVKIFRVPRSGNGKNLWEKKSSPPPPFHALFF